MSIYDVNRDFDPNKLLVKTSFFLGIGIIMAGCYLSQPKGLEKKVGPEQKIEQKEKAPNKKFEPLRETYFV